MEISLIGILVFLIVIGLILYVVQLLPIDATIKRIIYIVLVVFIVIYLLQLLVGVGPVIRLR